VFSGSRIGSTNTFTISGIFNSTTTSYTSSQSDTGDIVQVQSGARFYWLHIYSIASNAGGVITCNVRDSSSTLTTFPLGKWSIFRPTPNLRLPLSPDGETNASRSSTFNTLAMRVDEIQTAVASATNCEQTFTKASHGFRKGTPVFWNGSTYIRPTADSLVPDFVVVDSLTANTFKVANCGTYTTALANGLYWFTSASPGYSLTADTTKVPLFQAINGKLILNPIVGFNLMSNSIGITDGDKGNITVTDNGETWTIDNGVVSNAKLTTNAVDSTKAANLSPNDLAQTGAATNDVLTWTGSKYAPRPASGGGSGTVTGTGTSGQGAYWDGVSSIAGGTGFLYDGSGTITLGTALTTPILRGSTSANGDLVIDGTSSATKTSSYVDIQQGGGYAGINTGSSANNLAIPLHIGASTYSPSSDPVILINRPISNATGSGNAHAFSDASGITRTGSIGYNSFDALPLFSGASFDHYVAFQGRADFNNSGNTTGNCYGLWTKTNNIAGTITNNFGAYAANPTNTGTIATNYGFYTESQTAGTTNYGFYANGTMPNYFGGNLALGGAPITNNKLSVVATNADFATYISNSAAAGSSYGLVVDAGGNASDISLRVRSRASVDYLYVRGDGNVGIGIASPTARVHLRTGTATANTAPLKFNSGTNLTTAEAGAIEYDGTEFYATNSTASRTTIIRGLKGSATLDFPNTAPIGASDLTITVTGAAVGDVVALGIPDGSTNGSTNYHAWVSATNTVKIRMFNANAGGAFDPASGTFSIVVFK